MVLAAFAASEAGAQERRVLAFHKWNGAAHGATDTCLARLASHLRDRGVTLDRTRDSLALSPANLARYRVLLFMNTNYRSGRILDRSQEEAVEGFVHGGGGFIGIHNATPLGGSAELEAVWPWFYRLWGTRFAGHPNAEEGVAVLEDSTHPSTRGLPRRLVLKDEWYLLRDDPRAVPGVSVHAHVDAATLASGGKDRVLTWSRTFEGGRAWFTTLGHDLGTFGNADFLNHVTGGIAWAGGWDGSTGITARPRRVLEPLHGSGRYGLFILFPDGPGLRTLSGRQVTPPPSLPTR
jgi:type 1 glutamine amidotransferase